MTLPYEDELCSHGDVGQFRDEETLGSLTLDGFTAPIIALGGAIGAGIEEVAEVEPPWVVRT